MYSTYCTGRSRSRSKKCADVMRQSSATANQNDTVAINTLTAVNINRALNKQTTLLNDANKITIMIMAIIIVIK